MKYNAVIIVLYYQHCYYLNTIKGVNKRQKLTQGGIRAKQELS